jgi:hypothetical protein
MFAHQIQEKFKICAGLVQLSGVSALARLMLAMLLHQWPRSTAETHIGRRNNTKFNYVKAARENYCGSIRGRTLISTSGRKAVYLKPLSQTPDVACRKIIRYVSFPQIAYEKERVNDLFGHISTVSQVLHVMQHRVSVTNLRLIILKLTAECDRLEFGQVFSSQSIIKHSMTTVLKIIDKFISFEQLTFHSERSN